MTQMIRTYLEDLSLVQLTERLAQIEALGKATSKRLAAGECDDTVTLAVRKGSFVGVGRLESALNVQRSAWKLTKLEISRREA
jgi:hypothetical protein